MHPFRESRNEERDSKREITKKKGGKENWIIRHGRVVNVIRKHVEKEVKGVQSAIAMLGERDRVDTKE